ncbi:MAG: hypothetical protein JRF30_03460 [Deltaproteobacteria bacterium]|nr:hypothetical protein [Deltaproteobacteria bacterium]MBW1793613.1 hypothetical protein [Deltaproteobacteria bacterium]MBW2329993.1 hypothetical protein [Deltaproteobacteria bacterium]
MPVSPDLVADSLREEITIEKPGGVMTDLEKEMPIRLEDIISWAKAGKTVKADVELAKEDIVQKVLVEAGDVEEIYAYLLGGNFTFDVDGKMYKVSKTYLRGYASESIEVAAANRNIASARLKMDYDRLMESGIGLEEKYFEKMRL